MNVYCFGCSWTYGQKSGVPGGFNWVNSLAKRYPDFKFHNYAIPGSSLLFSVSQLEAVKKDKKDNQGLYLFQITNPFRYTSWDQGTIGRLTEQNKHGVYQYSVKAIQSLERYYASWRDDSKKENKKFFKLYYEKHSNLAEKTQYKALTEYVKMNTDFAFYQRRHKSITDLTLPCVYDILGDEKCKSFEHDDGYHFGESGCEWVADFIEQKVKLKYIR